MSPLAEVAWVFFKLGTTAFGGPAAHIAMMRQECVVRRQWLTEAEFLDLLGATNLLPGPNSTEMAIHLGLIRAGWPGLVVAGLCFIVPAAALVISLGWLYQRFGHLPQLGRALVWVQPVMIAVVIQAISGLLRPAAKTRGLALLGGLALALALAGIDELVLLFGAGLYWGTQHWARQALRPWKSVATLWASAGAKVALPTLMTLAPSGPMAYSLSALFMFFLKIGAVLYGSGYVLLAFLQDALVRDWGWLTASQLLDAITVGQVTPGPVFTTATFVGYLLGGLPGAGWATLGIFLPSFVLVALSGKLVPRLRQSPVASACLDGVNVASLALMGAVTLTLGAQVLQTPLSWGILTISALLLIYLRINATWLIALSLLAGALMG